MRTKKILDWFTQQQRINRIVKQRIDNQDDRYDRLEQRQHELEQFTWASVSREGIDAVAEPPEEAGDRANARQEAKPLETPEDLIEGELPAHRAEAAGFEAIRDRIGRAISNERAVYFWYTKEGEPMSEDRLLSPYELKKVHNGVVMLGWDHVREDIRSFRLDRIDKLRLSEGSIYRKPA